MKFVRIRVGDHVTEVEGRHVGRVEHIYGGLLGGRWATSAVAKIKWLDSGFVSEIAVGDLVIVTGERS